MTHADSDGSERELSSYLAADKAEPAPDADRPKWADLWGIDPDFELMPDPEVAALRATVERVEALATSLAGRGKGKAFPETTAWATWASERIRAALAGDAEPEAICCGQYDYHANRACGANCDKPPYDRCATCGHERMRHYRGDGCYGCMDPESAHPHPGWCEFAEPEASETAGDA